MSDHRAVVPLLSMRRELATRRAWDALADSGARFNGVVRAIRWNAAQGLWERDESDAGGRLRVTTVNEAVEQSASWQGAALELEGLGTAFVLEVWTATSPEASGLALVFPHELYERASDDASTARQWVNLLAEVKETMLTAWLSCGTETPRTALPVEQLERWIIDRLESHRASDLAVHTVISSAFSEEDSKSPLERASYTHRGSLFAGPRVVSELPFDE